LEAPKVTLTSKAKLLASGGDGGGSGNGPGGVGSTTSDNGKNGRTGGAGFAGGGGGGVGRIVIHTDDANSVEVSPLTPTPGVCTSIGELTPLPN